MDQVTARRLATIMSHSEGIIYVALTDHALRGDFDGPDAQWVVKQIGGLGNLITAAPVRYQEALLDAALDDLPNIVRSLPPSRPDGEENDTKTVTELRKYLALVYAELYGEDLRMRPTRELITRLVHDARQQVKG